MNIFEKEKELFLQTYSRIKIDLSHAEGVYLYDKSGNRYIDFFSGLGVNALGYSHPEIVSAVTEQISRYAHLSNNFITDIQIEFTELLLNYSEMSKAFLTNSGTEAVEGAIKLIRKAYGPEKTIFSLTNSFHGRTYGAMTLTGKEKYQKGYEPLLPNIQYINFNDIDDLKKRVNKETAAIFLEFIQGEGGIFVVTKEFAEELISLREKFGFAIVADGIQCGAGRTGKPYSHNHLGIKPDIILSAKAIGGGLPLGAFLTSPKFDNILELGKHGTTFGGNPVSCAAGKVVLEEVFEKGLMQNVEENGKYFLQGLNQFKNIYPDKIKEVRGRGYMLGVELIKPCASIVAKMFEKKILTNCTNDNVIRILPPLILEKKHIDFYLENFQQIVKEF